MSMVRIATPGEFLLGTRGSEATPARVSPPRVIRQDRYLGTSLVKRRSSADVFLHSHRLDSTCQCVTNHPAWRIQASVARSARSPGKHSRLERRFPFQHRI